jgi:HAMP domain-containing protein
VTRVAREVGTEGKLGGQAEVPGVSGTWKDLTDNVNSMASGLTAQVRNIADVATAVANGDLGQKITVDVRARSSSSRTPSTRWSTAQRLRRRGDARRPRGRHRGQARRPGRGQGRVGHLEGPDRQRQPDGQQPDRPGPQHRRGHDRGRHGDLSKKITVDVKGEILELKNTINTMVDQLNASPTR